MEQRIARRSPEQGAVGNALSDPPSLLILTWPILAASSSFLHVDRLQSLFVAVAVALLGMMVLARLGRPNMQGGRLLIPANLLIVSGLLIVIAQSIFRAPDSVMQPTAKIVITLRLVSFAGVVFFAFSGVSEPARRSRFRALLLSLPLFVLVNVALLPTMATGPETNAPLSLSQVNSTLQVIGLIVPRLRILPSVQGAATIALLAASSILVLIYLTATSRAWKILYIALMIPSAVVLVLSDTRQIIVTTVVCLAIYACSLRRAAWITRATLILAVVSAPLLILVQKLIGSLGVADLGVRVGGGERFGALTGRDNIWNAAFAELAHPSAEHVLGYGQYGDVVVGISSSYAWMFSGEVGIASYHNAFLQYVLDSGYLSAVLYFAAMWATISAYARGALGAGASRVVLALIAMTLLGGFSEAIGSIRSFEHFTFLLGLMTLATVLPADPKRRLANVDNVPGR